MKGSEKRRPLARPRMSWMPGQGAETLSRMDHRTRRGLRSDLSGVCVHFLKYSNFFFDSAFILVKMKHY